MDILQERWIETTVNAVTPFKVTKTGKVEAISLLSKKQYKEQIKCSGAFLVRFRQNGNELFFHIVMTMNSGYPTTTVDRNNSQ